MEIPTWTAFAAAWLATLAIFLLSKHLRQRKLKLPPGPKPWPVIGNLNLLGSLPHRSITELSKKYGPLMQLRFGTKPVVVGSSVKIAKTMLKTMDATLAGRPQTAGGKYISYNRTDITWSQYGPYFRQARKMFIMELFSPKRLESFKYMRIEERNSLLHELYKSSGKPIMLRDYLNTVSLNLITRMVLGKRYLDDSPDSIMTPKEFKTMVEETLTLNGAINVGDYIPGLNFLDLQGYIKRMKNLNKKLDWFLEHVIDEHNAQRKGVDNYEAKDMVDVLLEAVEDPTLEVKIERHGVKSLIVDLLIPGTDSSAVTVEWAISELLKKPELIKKAIEELDRVVGKNRWVDEKDIENLPYIQAIIKETMRLHHVTPLLFPRCALEDCQIDGYDIKKGTIVLVNVWSIGRDPTLWDEPNEFCPERFIGKSIDIKGQDFELLGFGAGRRMCPGYSLGIKVIQSSLANILHGYNWRLPDNMSPGDLNMEETAALATPRKIPLVAIADPRLPLELYSS